MMLAEVHEGYAAVAQYAALSRRLATLPRAKIKHPLCRLERMGGWPMLSERHWSLTSPKDMCR